MSVSLSTRRPLTLLDGLPRLLVFSQIMAVLWWLAAIWARSLDAIPVWQDQETVFTQVGRHLLNPYAVNEFVNPPWAALPLTPFAYMPLSLAVLLQLGLTYGLLTLVIHRWGGKTRETVLVLTSFLAFNAALELSVDWIVFLGLLVPPRWSGLLLAAKPQLALAVPVTYSRRDFVQSVIIGLAGLLLSFVIWGAWVEPMLAMLRSNGNLTHFFNIAPMRIMPPPIALAIGFFLLWRAFRRKDPALSVLAGLFFVPYITLYSLFLHAAALAVRWFRLALIISLAMWVIYGSVFVIGLLSFRASPP